MQILRKADVLKKTGLGQTLLYEKMKQGTFPKPIPISTQRVGWVDAEIDAWINQRIAARDTKAA